MHFLCYLRQLDSGILTESCFLRLGTGKACEHTGCHCRPPPSSLRIHRCKQTYTCTTDIHRFLNCGEVFFFFLLRNTLGRTIFISMKSRQSECITIPGPNRISDISSVAWRQNRPRCFFRIFCQPWDLSFLYVQIGYKPWIWQSAFCSAFPFGFVAAWTVLYSQMSSQKCTCSYFLQRFSPERPFPSPAGVAGRGWFVVDSPLRTWGW